MKNLNSNSSQFRIWFSVRSTLGLGGFLGLWVQAKTGHKVYRMYTDYRVLVVNPPPKKSWSHPILKPVSGISSPPISIRHGDWRGSPLAPPRLMHSPPLSVFATFQFTNSHIVIDITIISSPPTMNDRTIRSSKSRNIRTGGR